MEVPFLDDYSIYNSARGFLQTYHPSLVLPIPIENIIEIKLGLNILPIKNLESGCHIDGSLGKDFKTILIDEYEFEHLIQRARFTLAHEVGHFTLHKTVFEKSGSFVDEEEFLAFQNRLGDREYKRLEIQAYRFAEEILFPKSILASIVEETIKKLGGLDALVVTDFEKILSVISEKFDVSDKAAFNKVRRDFPSLFETIEANVPF